MYLKIHIPAFQWFSRGLLENLLRTPTAKLISDLVLHKKIKLPTSFLYNFSSTSADVSSTDNFRSTSIGV